MLQHNEVLMLKHNQQSTKPESINLQTPTSAGYHRMQPEEFTVDNLIAKDQGQKR